jgi:hypothetical protein
MVGLPGMVGGNGVVSGSTGSADQASARSWPTMGVSSMVGVVEVLSG